MIEIDNWDTVRSEAECDKCSARREQEEAVVDKERTTSGPGDFDLRNEGIEKHVATIKKWERARAGAGDEGALKQNKSAVEKQKG